MLAASVAVVALLVSALASQTPGAPPADPYTGDDPVAMTKAGIIAVQRFTWTDDHSTIDIQSLMGFEPFRFVETAHFKVASSLTSMPMPNDADARARLRRELVDLRALLPSVDPDVRTLDPWLRTHLYVRRLERLYTDFARHFGVTDAAMAKCVPGGAFTPTYAGEGPFLGQRGKFLIVLARSSASVGTYARNFLDLAAPRTTTRHHLPKAGSLLVLTAEDLADELLRDDATLHAAVVYHTAHALLDGYRHYWHDCPVWFEEGVAHWFRIQAEPTRACFAQRPNEQPAQPAAVDWRVKVRARVAQSNFVKTEDLFRLRYESARFEDHLAAWSRVDFLLSAHADGFPLFARQLKGPDATAVPPVPTAESVAARQTNALERVFGWSPVDLDQRWLAWVLKTYPQP